MSIDLKKADIQMKTLEIGKEGLVSRAQAKKLIASFEEFNEITLDFEGVTFVGQPFCDEVFRVFGGKNPNIHLGVINTTESIDRMIKHVGARANL